MFSGRRRTVLKEKEMSKELDDESSSGDLRIELLDYEIPLVDHVVRLNLPMEGETPQDPVTAKTGIGTVIGTYKAVFDGRNDVQVVVKLDEGGEIREFSFPQGKYSVGDRYGDK
jgi:hypothetical protein